MTLGRSRPEKQKRVDLGPKTRVGRCRPEKLLRSGPDQAQTAGLGQNPSGPYTCLWARTRLAQKRKIKNEEGGNYFPPPSPACRIRRQNLGKEKKRRGESVPGAAWTVVCWRGCGGVARGRRLRTALLLFLTVAKNFFLLPFPLFFSFSVYQSRFAFCFRFRFPSFWFVFVLPSLSIFGSFFFSLFSPSPSSVFSIYRQQNGAGMPFVSAPSITQRLVGHWGEFDGGGGEERERRDV